MELAQKLKSLTKGQEEAAEEIPFEDESIEKASSEEVVVNTDLDDEKAPTSPSVRMDRSVSKSDVEQAKADLHVLCLERDAVKLAVQHISESQLHQKNNARASRGQLAERYKTHLNILEREIRNKELLLNLYNLEKTQTELIQIFNMQLDEINQKIESVRNALDLAPQKQTSIFYYYKS